MVCSRRGVIRRRKGTKGNAGGCQSPAGCRSFGKGPSPTPPGWAPVGLRYHALHHYFPGIPYHNLGFAYQRLITSLPEAAGYREITSPGLPWSLRHFVRYRENRVTRKKKGRGLSTLGAPAQPPQSVTGAGTIRTRLSAVRKMTIIFSLRGTKYPKKAKNRSSGELSTSPGRGGSTAASSIPPAFSI